jgi:hypothetical protein
MKKAKMQLYEWSQKNNKKNNLGNGHRFRRGFLKPFGQNPTKWASISRVQKRRRTEESSAETLDTKRIRLDVTDPGLEIKEREALSLAAQSPLNLRMEDDQ